MAILRQVTGNAFFNIPDEQLEQYMIPEDAQVAVLKENGILLGVAGTPPADAKVQQLQVDAGVQTSDASASYMRWRRVSCPHCGTGNRILEDTDQYLWFRCGGCGGAFRF